MCTGQHAGKADTLLRLHGQHNSAGWPPNRAAMRPSAAAPRTLRSGAPSRSAGHVRLRRCLGFGRGWAAWAAEVRLRPPNGPGGGPRRRAGGGRRAARP
eukprot:scaffold1702_cov391-Prasinococcus_capsulatus_cf.AAC.13